MPIASHLLTNPVPDRNKSADDEQICGPKRSMIIALWSAIGLVAIFLAIHSIAPNWTAAVADLFATSRPTLQRCAAIVGEADRLACYDKFIVQSGLPAKGGLSPHFPAPQR